MKVSVLRVPYDSGHHRKRMGLGPECIFDSGLKPLFARSGTQVEDQEIAAKTSYPAEIGTAFELCREISARVRQSRGNEEFPLVLSGNCIAAVGTVSGCEANETGVVWFDAHGESTTPETTSSGFLDGMPISTLLGRAWQTLAKSVPGFGAIKGDRILLFGAHDVEPAERELLNSAGVRQTADLDHLTEHLSAIAKQVQQIYMHVDLDVLDPSAATANQWASSGGITIECLLDAIKHVCNHAKVGALGIASYDPAVDRDRRALDAAIRIVETVLRAN